MTPVKATQRKFVSRPSRRTRTASTFRLDLLMEEAQRLEIANRITALRERSPWGQPQIATKLGIGLRAYQKVEKVGTSHFDRCEELAKIHEEWAAHDPDWKHVSAGWIWDGRDRTVTPDLLSDLGASETQLDRIERRLDDLYELLKPTDDAEALEAELDAADQQAAAPAEGTAPSVRGQRRRRRAR